MLEDLIWKKRSCRRFYQNRPLSKETLGALVNLARLSPSAAEAVGPDDNIRYWRDAKGIHHVPKRDLKDIIIEMD